MKLLNFMTLQVEFGTGKRTRKQREDVAGKKLHESEGQLSVNRRARMAYLVVLKTERENA